MMKCNWYRKCVYLNRSLAGGVAIGGLIGEGVMFSVIDWGTRSKASSYISLLLWSDAVSSQMRAASRDLLIEFDRRQSSNLYFEKQQNSSNVQIKGKDTSLC